MQKNIQVIFAEDEILFKLGELKESIGNPPRIPWFASEKELVRLDLHKEQIEKEKGLIKELENIRRKELIERNKS